MNDREKEVLFLKKLDQIIFCNHQHRLWQS